MRLAGNPRWMPVPDSDFGGRESDVADRVHYQGAVFIGGGLRGRYPPGMGQAIMLPVFVMDTAPTQRASNPITFQALYRSP